MYDEREHTHACIMMCEASLLRSEVALQNIRLAGCQAPHWTGTRNSPGLWTLLRRFCPWSVLGLLTRLQSYEVPVAFAVGVLDPDADLPLGAAPRMDPQESLLGRSLVETFLEHRLETGALGPMRLAEWSPTPGPGTPTPMVTLLWFGGGTSTAPARGSRS